MDDDDEDDNGTTISEVDIEDRSTSESNNSIITITPSLAINNFSHYNQSQHRTHSNNHQQIVALAAVAAAAAVSSSTNNNNNGSIATTISSTNANNNNNNDGICPSAKLIGIVGQQQVKTGRKPRRRRTAFTHAQLAFLERKFR